MSELVQRMQAALSADSEEPKYRLLAEAISADIEAGRLEPDQRLPASRQLAADLKLHRNTINKAFEELNNRGLVRSVVGSGTFVESKQKPASETGEASAASIPWQALVSSVATAEPLTRFQRLNRYVGSDDYINMSRMHPSSELIPAELIRKCADHVIRTQGPEIFGYGPARGLGRLCSLIAVELNRAGIPADDDSILITTGSQQGLDLVGRLLCNPGDVILMEEHSYAGAINAFTSMGATIRPMPCDQDGPAMTALEAVQPGSVKALYLMPNCSNPTGRTISEARRKALLNWSVRKGVPIIEDDYGADLDDQGTPPAMRSMDQNVIYLGTFSKKLAPALRVGFIISPDALVQRIVALKQAMDLGTSLLQQSILAEFMGRGYLRRHLRNIQAAYHSRRHALADVLQEYLPEGSRLRVPESGVLLWLQLPPGMNSEDLFREALEFGVLVSPGSFHSVSPEASSGVRLTFCAESEERLRRGGRLLCQAIESVQNKAEMQTTNNTSSLDGV